MPPLTISYWLLPSTVLIIVIACLCSLLSDKFILRQTKTPRERISTLIFEFENFDNDLAQTASNACRISKHVFIYSESFIYPPVDLTTTASITDCQIKTIEKHGSPYSSYLELNLAHLIKSPYVLVLPDSTRIVDFAASTKGPALLDELEQQSDRDGLLFPIYPDTDAVVGDIACYQIHFDAKRWTLTYEPERRPGSHCEYIHEHGFALLIRTEAFFKLHRPLSRPFAHSFSIQSHIANLSIQLVNTGKTFVQGGKLRATERLRVKHARLEEYRIKQLYHQLGIKKVVDGSEPNGTEWHGCDRHKPRCFGTILNDVPEYLIQKRWTPPCCLRNLEITGRYVFELLDKFAVRYWLEGGSLLGAARNGQIIEWDYDIDIGVYREDCAKLPMLERLFAGEAGSQIEDGQGFLWEKAAEGDFVKVHYSRTNRMHVDIFAFEAVNGTMTKHFWFKDHPQDMPFPEHYLTPLTKVDFIGVQTSAPNHVWQFLEMKFGKGAIENPKYPRGAPGLKMD